MNMDDYNTKNWLNTLRSFATFSVIILHLSVPLVSSYHNSSFYSWFAGNILDGASRFCVPVFLMISGVLLLGKNYSLKIFLQKRMIRIILPFLFWSVIYFFVVNDLSDSVFNIAIDFFKRMKSGMEYHLWYIYMIIGIYLFLPIINKWIQNSSKIEIQYYLFIWFIILFVGMPYFNIFFTRIDFRYFTGYLGYAILGYYLNYFFISFKKKTATSLFLFASCLTIGLTGFFTLKENEFCKDYYNYLSPNVVLQSAGIFLLFKNIIVKNKTVLLISNVISKYSFGIYLSHVFVISILNKAGIEVSFEFPIASVLSIGILCLLISLLITYFLNKIPFVKYFAG